MSANKIKQDKMATMIEFCFRKTKISKDTGKILSEQADISDENKSGIVKVCMGKSLQYKEANALLRCLIAAMLIGDEEEEEEVGEAVEEMLTQPKTQCVEETPLPSGSLLESSQSQYQDRTVAKEGEARDRGKEICRFYKNGTCKFGKECRKEHPKFCKKFTKHGLRKHNPQGCDCKCGKVHPNACRESLRSKECSRDQCRFYHIGGTKMTKNQDNPRESEKPERETRESRETKGEVETKSKDQVFLEVQQAMLTAIQRLGRQMEDMTAWVQPHAQTQPQPQLRPQTQQTPQRWTNPQIQENWRGPSQRNSQYNN